MISKEYKILDGTYRFIIEYGLEKFSLNELLKYLKISKGTFYHYYNSKDEMILEIFEYMITMYISKNQRNLKKAKNLKEKLEILFEPYLVESKENKDFLVFYKEFILSKNYNESLKEHSSRMQVYLQDTISKILDEEVQKQNIKLEALDLATSIVCLVDGFLMYSFILEDFCLKDELDKFIFSFIKLVEIKK